MRIIFQKIVYFSNIFKKNLKRIKFTEITEIGYGTYYFEIAKT